MALVSSVPSGAEKRGGGEEEIRLEVHNVGDSGVGGGGGGGGGEGGIGVVLYKVVVFEVVGVVVVAREE